MLLNVFVLITLGYFHCVQSQVNLHTCCHKAGTGTEDGNESECFNMETKIIAADKTDSFRSKLPKYLPLDSKVETITKEMTFTLLPKVHGCSKESFSLQIPFTDVDVSDSSIIFKSKDIPILINEVPVNIYSNGYLRHGENNYSPTEFCISSYTTSSINVLICNATCGPKNPCVTKCCEIGEIWDLIEFPDGPIQCKPSGGKLWSPVLYSDPHTKVIDPHVQPHIITSHPRNWCLENDPIVVSRKKLDDDKATLFKILLDGKAWYKYDRRKWVNYTDGLYCVDGAMNFGRHIESFEGFENSTIVFDCGPEIKEPPISGTSELKGISMVFSSCFLAVTVVVYILLWEKQNVHGWTLLCYFTSLFFMYLLLAGVHFSSMFMTQGEDGGLCHAIAVLAHFFFLSSFCSMTTINFDIWWKFRALKPTDNRSKGIKRFLAYFAFSMGVPLFIVAIALTLDSVYGNDIESEVIVPDYGKKICYLEQKYAPLPYLYGPAGVLLTLNMFFFTVTIYAMYKIRQSTKFATNSSSKSNNQKQSALLFGKLFLVMGIPWVFEVVSWVVSPDPVDAAWYWTIFDLINIFQAIAIFMIFVFKKETLISLEGKYPRFQPVTIKPETAETILVRHPKLRFIINPLTRLPANQRNLSSRKTQSTVTEASRSRRSTRSVLDLEDKDKFGVELVESEPRGVLP